jgi:hypothetical protein
MRKSGTHLRPLGFCILFLALLFSGGSATAAESLDTGVVRNKLLIIDGKTEHAVMVGERKFLVRGDTAIFNLSGKQIPLIDLAVPCEATVQYRLIMDKNPEVLRLQVQKHLPGASSSPLFFLREK